MTVGQQNSDATTLLAHADAILLDFDGPVCSIFGGMPAQAIAHDLTRLLRRLTGDPEAIPDGEQDPLNVLRRAGRYGHLATGPIAEALTATEVKASRSATPTVGAEAFLSACGNAGLPVAIVSNNSTSAVRSYLDHRGIAEHVALVVGRMSDDPTVLKPSPYPVHLALAELNTPPTTAILIGDSTTDIEAARMAGVRSLGYANKPGKAAKLRAAGASGVLSNMLDATAAVLKHALF